jgi:hypothetical protein
MLLMACSGKSEKVWIVVDLIAPNGQPAQMAFNNPAVPDMTMAGCEGSLQAAMPALLQGIGSKPESAGSKYVSAKCVQSAEDPIKPKS